MICPLDMAFELVGIEIDRTKIARRVAADLVVEMRRGRIAAFSAGGDGLRPNSRPELDDRDEAVPACPIPSFRALFRPGAE